MGHRYAYIHNDKRSREFLHVDNVIDAGAAKIRRDAEWITYQKRNRSVSSVPVRCLVYD
jgi:hypothetical protein